LASSLGGSCLSPVPLPGSIWVEITYASPYGPECLKPGRNSFPASEASGFSEHKCGGAFVLFGDLISMAHSVKLTAYQPCWAYAFSVHLPNALEKSSACTFHVSLTLAILNSSPVISCQFKFCSGGFRVLVCAWWYHD